jgi:hypothetical protein
MSLLKCSVCGRDKPRQECEVIVLNEAEREAVRKLGQTPRDEYIYCKPCWRILGDREAGARLMRGFAVANFRAQGHRDPEAAADQVYRLFIEKSGKRLS